MGFGGFLHFSVQSTGGGVSLGDWPKPRGSSAFSAPYRRTSLCVGASAAPGLLKQLQQMRVPPGPAEHVCAWSQRRLCHPPGLLSSPLELAVLGPIP